ncbi:MAG: hypothetical protein ACOH2P_20170 [Pseudomonas sp.]
MNNVTRFLTAIAFSVAADANAAVEQKSCGSAASCFHLTPVAEKGGSAFLAENGSSRTPQGQQLENQTD